MFHVGSFNNQKEKTRRIHRVALTCGLILMVAMSAFLSTSLTAASYASPSWSWTRSCGLPVTVPVVVTTWALVTITPEWVTMKPDPLDRRTWRPNRGCLERNGRTELNWFSQFVLWVHVDAACEVGYTWRAKVSSNYTTAKEWGKLDGSVGNIWFNIQLCTSHTLTHFTPDKQFDVDNSRSYFLHDIGDEVELVSRAAGTGERTTCADMSKPAALIQRKDSKHKSHHPHPYTSL